jgi:hypothetical protein
MIGGYHRFEVRYTSSTAPGQHVWGWTDARKDVDRMLYAIGLNSNLSDPEIIDRAKSSSWDNLKARLDAGPIMIPPARPGMLL